MLTVLASGTSIFALEPGKNGSASARISPGHEFDSTAIGSDEPATSVVEKSNPLARLVSYPKIPNGISPSSLELNDNPESVPTTDVGVFYPELKLILQPPKSANCVFASTLTSLGGSLGIDFDSSYLAHFGNIQSVGAGLGKNKTNQPSYLPLLGIKFDDLSEILNFNVRQGGFSAMLAGGLLQPHFPAIRVSHLVNHGDNMDGPHLLDDLKHDPVGKGLA